MAGCITIKLVIKIGFHHNSFQMWSSTMNQAFVLWHFPGSNYLPEFLSQFKEFKYHIIFFNNIWLHWWTCIMENSWRVWHRIADKGKQLFWFYQKWLHSTCIVCLGLDSHRPVILMVTRRNVLFYWIKVIVFVTLF